MRYDIIYGATDGPLANVAIDLDVLATPRLISEGTLGVVLAYREDVTRAGQSVWRVADPEYDAEKHPYARPLPVRVRVVTDGPSIW